MAQTGTRSGSDQGRSRTARRVQHDRRPTPVGQRRGGGVLSSLRETVVVLVVALILASLLRAFVVQAFVVPSQSMENTLMGGGGVTNDRIVVDKLPGQSVRRGEIVVFADPGGWLAGEADQPTGSPSRLKRALEFVGVLPNNSTGHLVKRVVGVGGDKVTCAGGSKPLEVNGVALAETSYLFPGSLPCGPAAFAYTVPAGDLFVMGDNRQDSADSRDPSHKPFVPVSAVTGRVLAVVYPFGRLSRERIPADFATIPAAR